MQLEKVLAGNLCAGCGLCASIAGPERASMTADRSGYLRPAVTGPLTPRERELIDRSCPGGLLEHPPDASFTPVWGRIVDLYDGWATDPDTRFRGSSGAALTAILQYLLTRDDVDYVLQVGAALDAPWRNAMYESAKSAQVVANAGSRYAPSAPLADIVQRLERAERFAFVGKPCDVAALRMYAREDPRVDQKVTAMVSFMCAGVPGEAGHQELLRRMGVAPEDVAAFRFRGHGWPGRATATLHDGSERSLSYAETWGEVLNHHVQPRCKLCPDGLGVFADVVCADAWEVDAGGYPTFDERDGRSLVLSRSPIGAEILREARAAGVLALEPTTLAAVEQIQMHQARRTRLTPSRLVALAALRRPVPRYRGLRLARAARQAGVLANLRSLAGTVKRALRGRV